MPTIQRTIPNFYRDSVSLMQFSEQLCALPDVVQASAVMATESNITLLVEAGMIKDPPNPQPNDLLIVVDGEDEASLIAALDQAEEMLKRKSSEDQDGSRRLMPPRSSQMALREMPEANLVLISTPGEYAAAEALKALQLGLHVMLFSDNVSLEDEIRLKEYAHGHDLLVMGPDCGTAIINGIPLGFANVVSRGDIGVVAAAGTGLQQVTSLIDRAGGGISQAIGTGGHDLHQRVGGITMLQGIDALAADPATKVITLISKPPSAEVAEKILRRAAQCGKPVVVDFIGADPDSVEREGVLAAQTLEEAARASLNLSRGKRADDLPGPSAADLLVRAKSLATELQPGQKYIRGLFSGGTFCYETLLLLEKEVGPIFSNIPLNPEYRLQDVWKSQGHCAIDLGDDLFTQGRPHPMIDYRLRNERILQEASDAETAVILLDVVLGYGSHMDPAGELVPAIRQAQKIARQAGREVPFVASVCGTSSDPQNLERQEAALREAGVILVESNARAARLAAGICKHARVRR